MQFDNMERVYIQLILGLSANWYVAHRKVLLEPRSTVAVRCVRIEMANRL